MGSSMVRSVISGAGEAPPMAPSTAASMLVGVTLRCGTGTIGGTDGELGARASAMERGLARPGPGGSLCKLDSMRAASSSASSVRVICRSRDWPGSNWGGAPGGGGRRVGASAGVRRCCDEGPEARRANASTSNGGFTVGRSFSLSAPGWGGLTLRFLRRSSVMSVGLRHHAFEHTMRPGQALDLGLHRAHVALADGRTSLGHDRAGLLDGVASEVARRHDLLDLRE